jgi:hypothetical protein
MKHRVSRMVVVSGLGLVAAGAVLWAVGARASGIPAANALTYTGYLETPEGEPLSAEVNVSVALWSAASAGSKACEVAAEKLTPVSGRFQITLPEACTAAVKAQPDLWLETTVDGAALGRTKLGAVPYAIEAAHATRADTAGAADDASGALATRLDDVETSAERSKARLDAARSTTIRTEDNKVDVEISAESDWVWVSGTAAAQIKPGRYWVYAKAHVTTGVTGCTVQPCSNHANIATAACFKVGNKVEQLGNASYAQPVGAPDYVALTMANFDQFEVASAVNGQFGLCAVRPGEDPSTYSARLRQVFVVAVPQPD